MGNIRSSTRHSFSSVSFVRIRVKDQDVKDQDVEDQEDARKWKWYLLKKVGSAGKFMIKYPPNPR